MGRPTSVSTIAGPHMWVTSATGKCAEEPRRALGRRRIGARGSPAPHKMYLKRPDGFMPRSSTGTEEAVSRADSNNK